MPQNLIAAAGDRRQEAEPGPDFSHVKAIQGLRSVQVKRMGHSKQGEYFDPLVAQTVGKHLSPLAPNNRGFGGIASEGKSTVKVPREAVGSSKLLALDVNSFTPFGQESTVILEGKA